MRHQLNQCVAFQWRYFVTKKIMFVIAMTIALEIIVLLILPDANFILGPNQPGTNPIFALTAHPEWLIFYLTPLLLTFNKYSSLEELLPATVAVRIANRNYYLLSIFLVLFCFTIIYATLTILLPLLVFKKMFSPLWLLDMAFDAYVLNILTLIIAIFFNNSYALLIAISLLLLAVYTNSPFLPVNSLGPDLNFEWINLVAVLIWLLVIIPTSGSSFKRIDLY